MEAFHDDGNGNAQIELHQMNTSPATLLSDCYAGAAESAKADSSLECLVQSVATFELERRSSRTSVEANVPLPESRSSSITDTLNPQPPYATPLEEPAAQQLPSPTRPDRLPTSKGRRVRIEEPRPHADKESPPLSGGASAKDDESEPSPLWYRSQTFSHRYGASRQEPLLSPPIRASTLPVNLPSTRKRLIERIPRKSFSNIPAAQHHGAQLESTPGSGRDGLSETINDHSKHDPIAIKGTLKPTVKRQTTSDAVTGSRAGPHDVNTVPNDQISSAAPAVGLRGVERLTIAAPAQSAPAQVRIVVPQKIGGYGQDEVKRIRRHGTGDTDGSFGHSGARHGSEMTFVRKRTPRSTSARKITEPVDPDFNFHDYDDLVERLAEHMPHLVNVRGDECRRDYSGAIYCYDTLESGGLPRSLDEIHFSVHSRYPGYLANRVRNLKPDRVRNVRFRYILVEDLSPLVIRCLGSSFWLNPEFFEEHLNRSGYRPRSYRDPHPQTWITNETPKDYASVRWFRPVHRKRNKPLSELERATLLSNWGDLGWKASTEDAGLREKVLRLESNIFRREWALVSDPDKALAENQEDDSTFPVGWEERVTVHVSQNAGRPPTFIVLLDPLPSFSLESKSSKDEYAEHDRPTLFNQAYSRAPMGPRFGLLDIFDGNPLQERAIRLLADNLARTSCTREDLTSWLRSIHGARPDSSDMDMITGLLWIIHRDVVGFLHFVSAVLEEIGLHATDDYLIQKRLSHWRNLISRFQTELPAMRSSIKGFFEFVSQFQPLDQARPFVERTIRLIDELIRENEKSYAALRADMALLESKRAIDQAESVGKLTELGFIFIPISCIASLFSMQVQPLSSPAPIYSFFIFAFVTIGLIYIIRLTMRSAALIEYKRELSREIRLYMKLPLGAPIPTRIFIVYMFGDVKFHRFLRRRIWQPIGIIILVISALAALMLPIAFLWTHSKHMDTGFKGMLTVLIFIFDMGVVLPFALDILRKRGVIINTSGSRNSDVRLFKSRSKDSMRSHSQKSTNSSDYSGSTGARKPRNRWQRRLVATADWLLGRQGRRLNRESTSDFEHSDHVSFSSASITTDRTRRRRDRIHIPISDLFRNDREPRSHPYPMREEIGSEISYGETGPIIREERDTSVEEMVQPGSPKASSRRGSGQSFSDDEQYEQLAPGRTPRPSYPSHHDLQILTESPIADSIRTSSSTSFDPNTALVLYDHDTTTPEADRAHQGLGIPAASVKSSSNTANYLVDIRIEYKDSASGTKQTKGKGKIQDHDTGCHPTDSSKNEVEGDPRTRPDLRSPTNHQAILDFSPVSDPANSNRQGEASRPRKTTPEEHHTASIRSVPSDDTIGVPRSSTSSWRAMVFDAPEEARPLQKTVPCDKCRLDDAICLRNLASPCYRCEGLEYECSFDGVALDQLLCGDD